MLPLISYSQMQQTFSGETLYVNGSEYEIVGKSVDFMYDVLEVTVEDVINAPSDYDAVYNYDLYRDCLLYTSPSPRDATLSRMPSSA